MKCVIETTNGMVEGIEEKSYFRWFGIPFAKPPVGMLRFKRAVPSDSWAGIKFTDKMSPKPYQMAGGKFKKSTSTDNRESEDCLYLNVWSPKDASPLKEGKKHPVFVWIYGGGQHAGDAAAPEYNLKRFAENGVVAVSFNYRLGPLGFYDFSKYSKDFDSNCAISDMIMALKWINENISAFGGDPDRVTICGESAGGTAVISLLCAKSARPYFNQAIIMSGIMSNITWEATQKINNARLLKALEIEEKDIEVLRTISPEKIQAASRLFFEEEEIWNPGIMSSGPVLDDLITEKPKLVFNSGELSDKKIIFGTCRQEGGLFYYLDICPKTLSDIEKMFLNNGYDDKAEQLSEFYNLKDEEKAVKAVNRDRMFWADTMKMAISHSKFQDAFVYRFDMNTGLSYMLKMGPTHSMDVCPALGCFEGHNALLYKGVPSLVITNLRNRMNGAFINFVKTGNPSLEGKPVWPKFNEKNPEVMSFCRHSRVVSIKNDMKRLEFWKDIELYM